MRGVLRMTFFKDVFVVSGSGVGGGSLGYANTLYRARPAFFEDPQWAELGDWEASSPPTTTPPSGCWGSSSTRGSAPPTSCCKEYGEELGVGETFTNTRVGVFFDQPGVEVADPFFGGEGPARTGCMRCGSCMVGCRHGAKNTLMKNYLWFAEKLGVQIEPERQVTEIRPLGAADGSEGYTVASERSGSWLRKRRRTLTARGVIVAAGALGTNNLLANCQPQRRAAAHLTRGSATWSAPTPSRSRRSPPATTSATSAARWRSPRASIPTPTPISRWSPTARRGDAMSDTFTAMAGPGTRMTRPLKRLAEILRHPCRTARMMFPDSWSRRTVILLVMQTVDAAMQLRPKRKLFGRRAAADRAGPRAPNPTYIPAADAGGRWLAKRTGGIAQSAVTESILNVPTTAHILGGAVIGAGPEDGVVDSRKRVFGYENLLVCDGAAIPANLGVNPSLTITAQAEHAMSQVPPRRAPSRATSRRRRGRRRRRLVSSARVGETLSRRSPS